MLVAWRGFLCGKQKRKDVILFQVHLMDHLYTLQQELKNKTYVHGNYKQFNISDPKPRVIHKAAVRDRLVHHLVYQELYPYFDKRFIFDSYSCRIRKGTHKATRKLRGMARTVSKNHSKTCWVLKCDIQKFFASIDHTVLKKILASHITDSTILWLLGVIIDSFNTNGKVGVGLPLGNLTSQLFVNIYMNEFDYFLKRDMKIRYYVRYADDFVVLSLDKQYLENTLVSAGHFLETKLGLKLHPNKVSIETFSSGIDFLGWVHFPHHSVLRTSTKKRMLQNIQTKRDKKSLDSYKGMLQHGNAHKLSLRISDTKGEK